MPRPRRAPGNRSGRENFDTLEGGPQRPWHHYLRQNMRHTTEAQITRQRAELREHRMQVYRNDLLEEGEGYYQDNPEELEREVESQGEWLHRRAEPNYQSQPGDPDYPSPPPSPQYHPMTDEEWTAREHNRQPEAVSMPANPPQVVRRNTSLPEFRGGGLRGGSLMDRVTSQPGKWVTSSDGKTRFYQLDSDVKNGTNLLQKQKRSDQWLDANNISRKDFEALSPMDQLSMGFDTRKSDEYYGEPTSILESVVESLRNIDSNEAIKPILGMLDFVGAGRVFKAGLDAASTVAQFIPKRVSGQEKQQLAQQEQEEQEEQEMLTNNSSINKFSNAIGSNRPEIGPDGVLYDPESGGGLRLPGESRVNNRSRRGIVADRPAIRLHSNLANAVQITKHTPLDPEAENAIPEVNRKRRKVLDEGAGVGPHPVMNKIAAKAVRQGGGKISLFNYNPSVAGGFVNGKPGCMVLNPKGGKVKKQRVKRARKPPMYSKKGGMTFTSLKSTLITPGARV